ncbi:hypothetical protein MWU52_06795 [Jannaschia sp. S6380]|uniref:hypothetical protein n=1 Tax=Jannaschia sp. S6380 TaxID=2926408 RepID=UPI001FF5D324|nr:hypothetical protein [Jannaschia sp. S6380]MCK0167253.1 hypothetical protein [Jannaschia sp. S6380]
MKTGRTPTTAAPPEEGWDVLGPNDVHVRGWAFGIYVAAARPGGSRTADASVAKRVRETSLGPAMKMQSDKLLTNSLEELKPCNEVGKPHPRKVKGDASRRAVRARAAVA